MLAQCTSIKIDRKTKAFPAAVPQESFESSYPSPRLWRFCFKTPWAYVEWAQAYLNDVFDV
eukprot:6319939-Amphidinium_carterae.1